MIVPPAPHPWSVSPRRAVDIQKRLARLVRKTRLRVEVRFVAGLDCAFSSAGDRCIAGVTLWDVRERAVVEQHVAVRKPPVPYIPGLLSFREAPANLAALRKLRRAPDALICDGHGLAHPRRFGIACHVGLICDLPTIGCAKSRLIGAHRDPARRRGCRAALIDGEERIGSVLRTRDDVKPVFVSIGHRVDLATAERVVLACAVGYRLPEPTRLADRLVAAAKRQSA